jgi:condensation domain-containing protein
MDANQVPGGRVAVRFEGEGSGVEELSWGQLTLFEAMDRQRTWLPIGATVPLPAGTTVEDVAGRLRFWMGRYQSMRTRLRFDPDGRPRQVVASAGEISLEVVDAGEGDDPAKVAEQVERRFRETGYDFSAEWPVRMAVVRHRGVPTHQVLIVCHLVTDAAGVRVMMADLAARDPVTGEAASPPARMQPMEQARWQGSPAGQRVSEAAIRYMDGLARTMPPRRFGGSPDPRRPRYWELGFVSPATYLATRAIMSRTGADSGTVLLAVFAVAVARASGTNPAVTHVLVNNRFRPDLAGVVGPHSQGALLMVDLGGIGFDEALARTRRRAMAAYKNSYYDPYRKTYVRWAPEPEGMERRIGRERGVEIEVGCFFNDRRLRTLQGGQAGAEEAPTPEQVRAALARTTLRCVRQYDDPTENLFVHINDVPETIDVTAQIDTHHISPSGSEDLLYTMEAVAVEAAFDGAAPTRVPES